MRQTLKYFASALLVLLAVVNIALFAAVRADGYEKEITNYLHQGKNFTISSLNPDQAAQVEGYLNAKIFQEQAVLIRADKKTICCRRISGRNPSRSTRRPQQS